MKKIILEKITSFSADLRNLMNHAQPSRGSFLIPLVIVCFALSPQTRAVNNDRERLERLAGRIILFVLAGQADAAKATGEEARPLLEARLRDQPDDTIFMTALSWVYLALGRNADALRVFRHAAELIPVEKDALTGPAFQNGLAQIEARAGAPDEAIKRLRHLLSIPAESVSIARLKIDPVWDPIRNRPDFQQLLTIQEHVGPQLCR